MGGGPVTFTAKSRARGVGMGKRGDRLKGGGNRESMAIKEDSCAASTRSRVLGLKAQTDSIEGARGWEGAGMGAQ